MEKIYAAPQIFALMDSDYNLREVETRRANRKVSDSEKLLLDKRCDRGTFKGLVEKILEWL